jgi:hypothetical protein
MKNLKFLNLKNIKNRIKNYRPDILDVLYVFALIASAYIRFWQVKDFNFAFTFDQARDMLEIRPMAYLMDLKLTGPTTSINGLLLGPFYYYFSLPAFWLSGGSPQGLTNWNILWFLSVSTVLYVALKPINKLMTFFVALFYLLSSQLFVVTSYFWNANATVFIAALYFLTLFFLYQERLNKKYFSHGSDLSLNYAV